MTMKDLAVGDKIITRHGPYEAVATVIEIREAGAVLSYAPTATFVGGLPPVYAQGTLLAEGDLGWLGRAHWTAALRA
jgi:hypothetical protein